MARTKDLDRFFNKPTLAEALTSLEALWPKLTRSQEDVRERAVGVEIPVWIADEEGGRVGVRVMILATHLIYRFLSSSLTKLTTLVNTQKNPYFGLPELKADKIEDSIEEFNDAIAELAYDLDPNAPDYNPNRDRLAFVYFACKAKKAIDERRKEKHVHEVARAEALTLYDKIVADRCKTAEAVFSRIQQEWLHGLSYHAVKRPPVIRKIVSATPRTIHFIPDKMGDYLEPAGRFRVNRNPNELHQIAEDIIEQLTYTATRLVLISGKLNAGKSGCVVEILRRLNEGCPPIVGLSLKARGNSDPKLLPVFTVSVQDYTGSELLLHVLAFLSRLAQLSDQTELASFEGKLTELQSKYGKELEGDHLVAVKRQIRDLHRKNPALFILTNWEDLTWSTPRAQLRDQSKASLVALLHDSSTRSRFVVTTTSTPTDRSKRALPEYYIHEVPDPRLGDIKRYLPDLQYPECYGEALANANVRMRGASVPGDHLSLIAAALELCRGAPEWEARAIKALGKLSPALYSSPPVDPPYEFVRLLLERLHARDLFRIIMTIMASEDGLRPTSLIRLLQEWDADANMTLVRIGDEIKSGLEEVEVLANTFFLRNRMINPITTTQFSPTDSRLAKEKSWEIYETLRQTIMTALADPKQKGWAFHFNQTLRHATRHVAKLAFIRAQEWRVRTTFANLTPWWQDLLLDIQAYEALLASINPDNLSDGATNKAQIERMPLLHHASDAVFTCGDKHAAAVAVRFAVNVLLLGTVDHDNRMSMCYDQDIMRMRLYMLPFLGVGRRHFDRLDDKPFEDLPKKLPDWIDSVFSTEEILRLLEGVAISALHAQAPQLVLWAWIRTRELVKRHGHNEDDRRRLLIRTSRTYCSTIDMAIQLGKPLEDDSSACPDAKGHQRTLAQVGDFLRAEFTKIATLTASAAPETSPPVEDPDAIEAVLRIRVRHAQLLGLLGRLDEAEREFAGIHSWEMVLARLSRSGSSDVLEGRPARIALQMLMRGEIILRHATDRQTDVMNRVRGMLAANAARLARFGGAEQAANLVDRSRYAFLRERFELAYQYASEARQFCDDNRVSYGMQINIVLNLVAILIECSGTTPGRGPNRLGNARELEAAERDVDAVYQTACALVLRPTEGIALYLKVRLQQIRSLLHANKEGPTEKFEKPREKIDEAIAIMIECGDLSFRTAMEELRDALPLDTG
ncbi:hypothetical protein SAMN05880593_114122 [Rhizobium sp. RU36D]|nr:hypothetical protein SAMN05880593_114122 [Rhizobium sp. RU36D]